MISVSIIIPTKNGEKYLDRVLNMLFSQETAFDFEVIIIDSGSKDKTLKIIKKYPAQLIKIRPREFGHGKTRNYGVGISKGKFLVFLT
ncbi:glycosyltransferase family 2 protein, partial [Candidatus Dependentiae bacterium]|nr:glycosyltransferase family 2 protein [Candidatus Dependentiae bacterium]